MPRTEDGTSSPAGAASASLLIRLRGIKPSLSPAEDRVADIVLADARRAAGLTISELATAARTSETTVLRFCRRLGLPGYPQLRLALAEESAHPRTMNRGGTDISASDTIDDIIAKVAFSDASAVEETAQQLDRDALASAAAAIARAGRVDIYGIGASSIVGTDLQQKLHRIGIVAFAWNDPHIALTSATLLGPGDIAVGISHSGTTTETIEALAAARTTGARTLAITNFPLSRLASGVDILLTTAARETSLRSGATASRIAALTVVDCLYIAVAQRNLRKARKAVADTREAVAGHHVTD
ncbi:MurR/RpiR family transcriptional regulator [Terrabacter sp. Ter38]|uniref:MurR/RpiR family transcriptional regulator n=1 Tax=Terrabacter sp. Ter38 TaxID=2926030 RepID=UPI0021180E9F|nr:MurR/RpiR family transcriptional regulator [Terrabacter sp. Ter38]